MREFCQKIGCANSAINHSPYCSDSRCPGSEEKLMICVCCELSGETYIDQQKNLCELCDCSEEFTIQMARDYILAQTELLRRAIIHIEEQFDAKKNSEEVGQGT